MLWAVTNTLSGKTKPALDVPASDRDPTIRWRCIIGQTFEGRSLSSSIYSEQRKAFPSLQAKGNIVDCGQGLADSSPVYFLEAIDSYGHVIRATLGDSLLLLKHIIILDFNVRVIDWNFAICVLELPTCRPEATLAEAVEHTGPAILINNDLEQKDKNPTKTEMSTQGIKVTHLVVCGPTVKVNILRVVQDWVLHLAFKDFTSTTEKQRLADVIAGDDTKPLVNPVA